MLVQCGKPAEPPAPAATPPPEPAPVQRVIPVAPPPPLTRAELIDAAAKAASIYAAGQVATEADPLLGRTFSIRVKFGCAGPQQPPAVGTEGRARWWWDPGQKGIKLSLTPADWRRHPNVAGPVGVEADSALEAAEGFWVTRPWLPEAVCPAPVAVVAEGSTSGASPETLGLVTLFRAEDSRVRRRNGRAYSFTVKPGDQPLAAPSKGYNVLFEGRVTGFPDERAIHCHAAGPDQRPVCLIATQIDRVAFEDGVTGETLVDWREG